MNAARGCLFGLMYSIIFWIVLIGLVVVVSKSFGDDAANPQLLPPEGLVVIVPRILFPPEKNIELKDVRTALDYFLVATKLDKQYFITAIDFETQTKAKSIPSRQFWIAREGFGGDVDLGTSFAMFNTKFRIDIAKTIIPFVFRNQIDQIVGFPLKLKPSFDGRREDFYPNGDTFQISGLDMRIFDATGKEYNFRASWFDSALYHITNGTYAGASVDISPSRLTVYWGKIKNAK